MIPISNAVNTSLGHLDKQKKPLEEQKQEFELLKPIKPFKLKEIRIGHIV